MKKFLLLLSGLFATSTLYAQQMANKPIFCAPLQNVVAIAEQRGDYPVMYGDTTLQAQQGTMSAKVIIAHNFQTKTYSIIEVYNTNWACVLALGTKLTIMPPDGGMVPNDNSTDPFKGIPIEPDNSMTL